MNRSLVSAAAIIFVMYSCNGNKSGQTEETVVPKASVTVALLTKGRIENQLVLNGKTVFLKKNQVVAPISGYITKVNIKYGDKASKGKVLFEIQTRENRALLQSGSDNGFGRIEVQATTSGMVNEPVTLGEGAYVTEGTPLCILTDINDLIVKVNVPYENHKVILQGAHCRLFLPDQTQIEGTVSLIRPFVDEVSQTQEVLIKPLGNRSLPENMNLTASFLNTESPETQLLPKNALLTNETQDEFWVMKIVDDSIAVMVPVETGIKNDSLVEIISPLLNPEDIFILEGGYGLEDSSLVTIVLQP